MKKFKLLPMILLICLLFTCVAPCAFALDDPDVPAKAVLVVDLDTGDVLYSKNADQQRSPASLTKIMTGLLAVEAVENGQCSWDDIVTAGTDCNEGLGEDSSSSGILPGEQMTYKDLFYCAMIHSANEACNVLGSFIAGSIKDFVQMMNDRAQQLGCENTHFLDPNGLSNEGHYTTALDLYTITKEAISHQEFMEAVNTGYYEIPATNMNDMRKMYNSNALITQGGTYGDGYLYPGAAGVKTGYTRAAGYCLVSTAQKNDINALVITMGCNGPLNAGEEEYGNFVSTITLYDWVFDNFSRRTLLSSAAFTKKAEVELAEKDASAVLKPEKDIVALLPNDVADEDIKTQVTMYNDKLVAPVEAGAELGEVHVSVGDKDYGSVKLINSTTVELSKIEFIKQQLKKVFSKGWVIALIVIVAVIGAGYLLLVSHYRKLRRRHLEECRRAEQRRRQARAAAAEKAQYSQPEEPRYTYIEPEERRTDPADIDELFSRYYDDDEE